MNLRRNTSTNRRLPLLLLLATLVVPLGGCRMTVALGSFLAIPGSLLSNVGGWNLSACGGSGFQTCAGLLVDNQQQIFGGRTAEEMVYDTAVGFLGSLRSAKLDSSKLPD